jgi:hypothetical protein
MADEEMQGIPIYTAPLDGGIKRYMYLVLNKRFSIKVPSL